MLLAPYWIKGLTQDKKVDATSSPHTSGLKSHAKPLPWAWRSVAVPLCVTMVRGGSSKRAETVDGGAAGLEKSSVRGARGAASSERWAGPKEAGKGAARRSGATARDGVGLFLGGGETHIGETARGTRPKKVLKVICCAGTAGAAERDESAVGDVFKEPGRLLLEGEPRNGEEGGKGAPRTIVGRFDGGADVGEQGAAAWYDLGSRPQGPNLPAFGRFTRGAEASDAIAPAGTVPTKKVAVAEIATEIEIVVVVSPVEMGTTPVGMADAEGTKASRMRIREIPNAVLLLKRVRPRNTKANSAQNCSA